MKDGNQAMDDHEDPAAHRRGKSKAELVPVREGRAGSKIHDQPIFGMWKDRKDMADPSAYVRAIRKNRV